MPKSYIEFDGHRSTEFGMTIEELPTSSHAERRGDLYQIAGRNGSFVREDGTYENYEQAYAFNLRNISSPRDSYQSARDVALWLLGSTGFCRLEDSYEPEFYRMARYAGPLDVESVLRRYGRGTMVFDCQPERFLKSGETAITALEDVHSLEHETYELINPTGMVARPLIRVTGYGGVHFAVHPEGAAPLVIRTAVGTTRTVINIDCNSYAVTYADGTDASAEMTFVDSEGYPEFPTLQAGTNVVENIPFNGGGLIESLEIVPRWWSL